MSAKAKNAMLSSDTWLRRYWSLIVVILIWASIIGYWFLMLLAESSNVIPHIALHFLLYSSPADNVQVLPILVFVALLIELFRWNSLHDADGCIQFMRLILVTMILPAALCSSFFSVAGLPKFEATDSIEADNKHYVLAEYTTGSDGDYFWLFECQIGRFICRYTDFSEQVAYDAIGMSQLAYDAMNNELIISDGENTYTYPFDSD